MRPNELQDFDDARREMAATATPMDTGALAFPSYREDPMHPGLTKREYFAGLAMQGWIHTNPAQDCFPGDIARWSVECADALIAELNKVMP